ncbi:MAG: hypothetical protein QM775_12065 [Pirellulales bacterium]
MNRSFARILFVIAVAATATGLSIAQAADAQSEKPAAKKPASLDDELFEDLDLGKKPTAKTGDKPKAKPSGETPGGDGGQPTTPGEKPKTGDAKKPAGPTQPLKAQRTGRRAAPPTRR